MTVRVIARRRCRELAAVASAVVVWAMPASAMEFHVSPPLVLAAGEIKNGDENTFRRLLAERPKGSIRGVVLHSSGGFVYPAGEIGRLIRENGLITVVDASRFKCVSACTVLFAAGTARFYLHSAGISDGVARHASRGLGFHEGSSSLSRDANGYSGSGTARVIALLHEFGVPRAADLTTRAPPDGIYMVSGSTALEIGLATSLGPSGEGTPKKKGRP